MKAKAHTSVLRLEKSEKDVFFVSPRKVIRYKCTKLLLMGSCAFFEPCGEAVEHHGGELKTLTELTELI
jgi:hypothetical protein